MEEAVCARIEERLQDLESVKRVRSVAALAFGILFATAIILILVPVGYSILEDLKALWRRL